jgi:hypothetical protein
MCARKNYEIKKYATKIFARSLLSFKLSSLHLTMSNQADSELAMALRQRSLRFWIAASEEKYSASITMPDR